MHKLKAEYRVPADVKTVFTAMRDNHTEYWKDLPNIRSYRVLEEKKLSEKKKRMVIEWTGRAPIPRILQPIILPKMLKWVDTDVWDEEEFTLTWETKPYYYSEIFTCKGTWYVKKDGENKDSSIVIIDGFIDIRKPFFGGIAEKIVARYLMQNMRKTEKNLTGIVGKRE